MDSKRMEIPQINTDLFLLPPLLLLILQYLGWSKAEYLFALVCSDTARTPNLGQMWCQQDSNGNCQLQKIMEDTEPPQFLTGFPHVQTVLANHLILQTRVNENAVTYFIAYKSTLVPSDITATDIISGDTLADSSANVQSGKNVVAHVLLGNLTENTNYRILQLLLIAPWNPQHWQCTHVSGTAVTSRHYIACTICRKC